MRRSRVQPLSDIARRLVGARGVGYDVRIERARDGRLLDHVRAADLADQRLHQVTRSHGLLHEVPQVVTGDLLSIAEFENAVPHAAFDQVVLELAIILEVA